MWSEAEEMDTQTRYRFSGLSARALTFWQLINCRFDYNRP